VVIVSQFYSGRTGIHSFACATFPGVNNDSQYESHTKDIKKCETSSRRDIDFNKKYKNHLSCQLMPTKLSVPFK
jgi:hypothetical protein